MAIFRVHKETNYTTIDNNVFKNKELSYRATGLLTTMLSLPDDWDFTEMGLVTLKKESRETIRKTLKELEEHGYLTRIRNRDKKGRLTDTTYDIYETPMSKKPMLDKPMLEKPMLENYTQLNTNIINNLNNKILKNKYGEYKNVLLSENELKRLSSTYPNYEELINFLDEYIESLEPNKKKAYLKKNHNLCIKRWVVDAVEERKKEKKQSKKEIEDEYENYWKEKLSEEN